MVMDISVGLPSSSPSITGEFVVEWAQTAERGGLSSLVIRERVDGGLQESLIALAVAAGVTRRIRLVVSTVLPAARETTLLARQAASLDVMSGGRFILGVGVGYRAVDYEVAGYDFHERGRRLDAQLPQLRSIWAGETPPGGVGP